ncbi:MAG: glycosyltransferase family 2 protein [Cyanobacteria bacterium CRU_2_1]|nr:glycosyltransferase family 2 protein [Cyanobacteria bacterium CRU_2_1]
MPTLALCIPAYNAANYLPRLLKSAHTQTQPFDEIWVYNDCSTDHTAEVARSLGAKVVTGNTNRGCSSGKNALAQQTECDWIHFHDADDALYPHFVESARRWMEQADAPDVVLFDYEVREDSSDRLLHVRHFDAGDLKRDPISYCLREQINPFCGLYRRSAYLQAGGYDTDPQVLYNEDVAFHCRMAIAGLTFAADPTITVINYLRSGSMSAANQIKCVQAQYHVMHKASVALQGRYNEEISARLWKLVGVAGAYLDWQTVDAAIALATHLTRKFPAEMGLFFKLMCSLNPYMAVRAGNG